VATSPTGTGWARTLARTWDAVGELADWGYPFPLDEGGAQYRGSLQGPEYMRLMRRKVRRAGVTIWISPPPWSCSSTPTAWSPAPRGTPSAR